MTESETIPKAEAPPAPPRQDTPSNRYVVRYGIPRFVAEFGARGRDIYDRGQAVVVRSDRGQELGEVLCVASDKTREWLGVTESKGQILRLVNDDDRKRSDEQVAREREFFRGGKELIEQSRLQMQLVDVEHLFGGERLVFYYVAETRIDFRELVKGLASRFHMRIEMRQIGVRDEAKFLADYGDCGKPVCCNTHLREMPPVSMKMAKLQKATLDPNKISGRCGRLKCCLRYEYDTYEAHRKELPPIGVLVVTKQGQGKVLNHELLAKKLLVQFEDRRMLVIDANDVLTVLGRPKREDRPEDRSERGADGGDATVDVGERTSESGSGPAEEPRKGRRPDGPRGGGGREGGPRDGGPPRDGGGPRKGPPPRGDGGTGPGTGPGPRPDRRGPGGGRPPRGPRPETGGGGGAPRGDSSPPPAPPESPPEDDFGAGVE